MRMQPPIAFGYPPVEQSTSIGKQSLKQGR